MSVPGSGTSEAPLGTVTFLFTDIEGSTALVRLLKGDYGNVLELHNRVLRDVFASHGGHEVDIQGDSFLVAFRRARDAVEAAADAQRSLAAVEWPAEAAVQVRMGIHTTEPGLRADGYHGLGVVRGARICAAGHGGQVLVSATTRSLIADDELDGMTVRDLGAHRLKGLEQPEQIYELVLDDAARSFPPLRAGAVPHGVEGREGELAAAAEAAVAGEERQFAILGPLEVRVQGVPLDLGGPKQRALLALLLLDAGRTVASDHLLDALWGEQPPRTAATSLQNLVSQLRKLLGPELIETKAPGYRLRIGDGELDARRFETLLARSRAEPPRERSQTLRQALALWRGPPLADFSYDAFAQSEIGRLAELQLSALEHRIDADLELGKHGELVAELEALVSANPLRERLRGQLMLALYRSGRQAEALQAFQDARRVLVAELGIEPGPALQRMHAAVLRQDHALTPAVPVAAEDHYGEVAKALLAGRVVPVIGLDVWEEPLEQRIAEQLATRFELEQQSGLSRIAQLVSLTQGIGPLYDELHDAFLREYPPGPVHELIATLPAVMRAAGAANPLILTTHCDDTLERALRAAGEQPDVVVYIAKGRDRGKFLHVSPDGAAIVVSVPNAYAELSLDDRPVVLKLHGQADARPERDRESFVVSEDDYIGYLAQSEIANIVPVTLAAKLRRSHFLFLGYPLREWHLRVFLHRVFGHERVAYRSWAVHPQPDQIEREFWRHRGVEMFDVPLDEYAERLAKRLEQRAPIPA